MFIEGHNPVVWFAPCETKQEYHKRRAKEESELISSLIGQYGYNQKSRTDIKRARKRKKYHEQIARRGW